MAFANLFLGLVLVSTISSAVFGAYAFRRRHVRAARPFAFLMAGQGIWSAGYLGELLARDQAGKIIWDNLQFVGSDAVAAGALLFALAYIGRSGGVARWLLVIVPFFSALVVWTDPQHALVRLQPRIETGGAFPTLAYGYGPWMWLLLIYDYALVSTAIGVVMLHSKGIHLRYRTQTLGVALGFAAPLIGTLLTIFGLVPISRMRTLDISPITFALGNPLLAWGLFRGRLFDVVPVARATLIEQIADGVLVVDSHRRLIDVTPRALALLGAPAGVTIGAPLAARLPWALPLLSAASPAVLEVRADTSGSPYDLEITATRLAAPLADTAGWLLVLRDITARKQAEAEREQLERALQATQRLESLGVLAGGIAHDFNNILASILGYADLARMDLAPDSDAYGYLTMVANGARRAADLTGQILAYAGRGRFLIEPVRISDLVYDSHDLAQVSTLHQATVRYELADDLPSFMADATQIRQVIMNLLTNAAEAGEGDGAILLTTAVEHLTRARLDRLILGAQLPEGRYIRLTVADSGRGMDAETLARIFDPFYTTKFIGRGLGLAVVHGIMRAHHGAISVTSAVGQGTTFSVWFPALGGPEEALAATAEPPAAQALGALLIVDDEPEVRRVAADLARRLGYTAYTAENGADALARLQHDIPDLRAVLLDLTMPEMSGEAVVHAIRRTHPHLPIVLMSGYSAHELADRFGHLQLHGMLQKPFDLDELRQVLGLRN